MRRAAMVCLICVCFTAAGAQGNLLKSSGADSETGWQKSGEAFIEKNSDDNRVFVVRYKGSFRQQVDFAEDVSGKYALLIGIGASERINADGSITGLPYLYGYLSGGNRSGGGVNAYLTGRNLLANVKSENEWAVMSGVFRIPQGTTSAIIFLKQAERKDLPQNGSAARFDKIGFYVFETEKEALDFARNYK